MTGRTWAVAVGLPCVILLGMIARTLVSPSRLTPHKAGGEVSGETSPPDHDDLPKPTISMRQGSPTVQARATAPSASASHAISPTDGVAEERRDALLARQATESRDEAWAVDATKMLGSSIRALEQDGIHVRDIECRQTICRVEMVSDNRAASRATQGMLRDPKTRPWNGDVYIYKETGTWPQNTTIFIGRPGAPSLL